MVCMYAVTYVRMYVATVNKIYVIGLMYVINMLNKNTWSVKSVGPIRSNIANRQA